MLWQTLLLLILCHVLFYLCLGALGGPVLQFILIEGMVVSASVAIVCIVAMFAILEKR